MSPTAPVPRAEEPGSRRGGDAELLPIGAASRLLGVSVSTLRRLEKSGKLAAYGVKVYYTPSRRRRYRRSEILAAVEASARG